MFTSILSTSTGSMTVLNALLCTGTSLLLGIIIGLVYMVQNRPTKSFVITLALLPVLVQAVIMMVNGNLGAGVAVLGAFSLVRFRSVPGSAKEIVSIFFAMAVGLATGMGHLAFAALITAVVSLAMLVMSKTGFGERVSPEKELKVTIPENLDYTQVFDDLFAKYTTKTSLEQVKTTNLGSMYELHYHIALKDISQEKEFLDELRCRNGNLTIICGRPRQARDEL